MVRWWCSIVGAYKWYFVFNLLNNSNIRADECPKFLIDKKILFYFKRCVSEKRFYKQTNLILKFFNLIKMKLKLCKAFGYYYTLALSFVSLLIILSTWKIYFKQKNMFFILYFNKPQNSIDVVTLRKQFIQLNYDQTISLSITRANKVSPRVILCSKIHIQSI